MNCFAHCQARLPSLHRATPFTHNPKTLSLARKTHLAFITKLNLCLSLRCDCLRDGDTDGVTVENMQTLRKPLESVNLRTKQSEEAAYERSDVCAVSAASVIVESVVAFEVAAAFVEKFGGDSVEEMAARCRLYHELARSR